MQSINVTRNLNLLFWMKLSMSMFSLTPVATLFYLHRGLNYPELFLLSVVFAVVTLVFEVPTGIIADIIGRKWAIIVGLFFYLSHGIWYLFAYGFLEMVFAFSLFAIGFTFLSGVVEAYIYDLLASDGREQEMKKEYGRYLSARSIPAFIMPFVSVFIAKDLLEWQFQVLLWIFIISMLVTLTISFNLQQVEHKKRKEDSYILLKDSWELFRNNSDLRQIFWNSALILIPFHLFWRIWQPYLLDFSLPVFFLGFIVSTHNILSFFLQRNIHALEEKIGMERLIFLTAIIPFMGYFLLIFTKNVVFSVIAVYLVFVLSVSRKPLISDYMNVHIHSRNRATALSLQNMFQGVIGIFAMLITAYASSYYQYAGLYVAIVLVGIGLVFFRLHDGHVANGVAKGS